MKKLKVTGSSKEFEEFVNREDIEILQLDVKGCEQNSQFQESFIAVIYYQNSLNPNGVSKEVDFGDYVEIEQFRYGAENEMYIYKVIKRFQSNTYIDVPVKSPNDKECLHDDVVNVVSCVCCGVSETKVEKFRIEDVKPTNKRF